METPGAEFTDGNYVSSFGKGALQPAIDAITRREPCLSETMKE
jgi:hypothetical protein